MATMKTMKKYQSGGTKGQSKLGPALGIGTTVTGAAALITKMIADKVKSKKAAKVEEEKKKAAKAAKKMTMQTGGVAKAGLGSPKAKIAASSKAMKNMKPATSKVGKTGTAPAKYKMGGAKKYQTGGTPFQGYMNTPGAVPSDTVMQTVWPGEKWDYPKKPVAKSPNNQNLLEKVYEQTYGQGWRSEDRKADDETFEQYKRRMGPLKQKGGAAKATYKTGGMVNPNAKVSALKKAGSKGVKPNVNPKAAAAKRATGRTGGTSTAPKKALPKAQMGTQVGKKDYMKPTSIDSTLTKRDVKKIIRNISKKKKN